MLLPLLDLVFPHKAGGGYRLRLLSNGARWLAAVITGGILAGVAMADDPQPAVPESKPDAAEATKAQTEGYALLERVAAAYRSAASLRVHGRTEGLIRKGFRQAHPYLFMKNGGFSDGKDPEVWVYESDLRILRDRYARHQTCLLNNQGDCYVYTPSGNRKVRYDSAVAGIVLPQLWPLMQRGVTRDGSSRWGPPMDFQPSLSLPLRLFSADAAEAVFPRSAYEVKELRQEAGGTLLVLSVRQGVVTTYVRPPGKAKPREQFELKSSVWKMRIDSQALLVSRVEVKETWSSLEAGKRDAVMEFTEEYTGQELNPRLTPEDFLLQPPLPVRPTSPLPPEPPVTPATPPSDKSQTGA